MEHETPFALTPDKKRIRHFFKQNSVDKPSNDYKDYGKFAMLAAREAQALRQQVFGSAEETIEAVDSGKADTLPGRFYVEAESALLHLASSGGHLYSAAFGGFEAGNSVIDEYVNYLTQLADIYNQAVDFSNTPEVDTRTKADLTRFLDTLKEFLVHVRAVFSDGKTRFTNASTQTVQAAAYDNQTGITYPGIRLTIKFLIVMIALSTLSTLFKLSSDPSPIDLLGFIFLALAVYLWMSTIHVYGRFPVETVDQMLKLTFKTGQIVTFLIGGIAITAGSFETFFPGSISPIPPLLDLTLGLLGITITCLPPSLLMLGASKAEAAPIYDEIVFAIFPLKVVHLIDEARFGIWYQDLGQSNYRTTKDDEWMSVVQVFMEMAPSIVMDTRIENEAVLEEAKYLLSSPELLKKTLFITNRDGSDAILSDIEASSGGSLPLLHRIASEDVGTAVRLVKRRLLSNRS